MCAKHTTLHNSTHTHRERDRAKRYSSVYTYTQRGKGTEVQRTRDTER